jgi:hypothetical protein
LTFADKDLLRDFTLARNREITIFSICLLVSRLIFTIVLIVEYTLSNVTIRRIMSEFLGMALHVLAMGLGWKFPLTMQRFHAPIVIISYGMNMVNTKVDFKVEDQISNIIGFHFILFTSNVFINSSWIPTCVCNFVMATVSVCYYRFELNFGLNQLLTSIYLTLILLSFTTYYCEKRVKTEFIQLRYNKRINQEMSQLIENIPEGIIIYNK